MQTSVDFYLTFDFNTIVTLGFNFYSTFVSRICWSRDFEKYDVCVEY
jgi:hypothetical protein